MGLLSSVWKDIKRGLKKVVTWVTGVKDFDVNDFNNGSLVNKQSNIEPLPVVYGERKIGGTRVFVATSGTNNTYLYVVLALCEGEVNQLGTVWINEIESTDARFTGKVTINKYVGTDAQTADSMLTSASVGWTSDHRLRGVAYLAMRFTYDQDTFGGGVPNVTCLVQGRKVLDTRTATTVYSTNPAVCLRDYLTNVRYGKGLSSAVIDDDSFEDAADQCDTLVTKYTASSTGPIFTCNAIINTANTAFDNVKVFLSGMRGLMPFNNGVYSLIIEDVYSSTFDFTEDNIRSDINVESAPKSQQYNRVTAKFTNPLANWQMDSVTWPEAGSSDYTNFLAADNSIELSTEINLPSTTDYYAARDIARIVCLESRLCKLSVSIVATSEALVCAIGDIVTLTHTSMGWTNKLFMVVGLQLYDDGEVGVELREHAASIYPWIVDQVQPDTYSSTLPNPLLVQAPTSFVITETTYLSSDGTVIPEIVVAWTAAADAFVEQYEVQYKLTTESDYFSEFVTQPRIVSAYAEVGKSYNVRVRAINGLGVRSAFLATTYTITGDVSGPEKPTNFTITGDITEARLDWDACVAKDYKETIVYASLTNTFASATEQVRISGTTVTYYALAEDTTYYGWIKHVDYSGNLGTVSDMVTFSTSRGSISPPTSLVKTETGLLAPDGTVVPRVKLSWTAGAGAQYYELEFKESAASVWDSVSIPTTSYESSGAKIGTTYDVRVRSVNDKFGKSTYLTGTFTPVGDTTAPATPTGLTITGDYNQAVLKWTASTEKDYKETLIYSNTTNDSSTATLAARISGTTVTYAGLPVSTTYYVWLKNEDYSGNVSGFGTGVSFNTTSGAAASSVVAGATIAGSATTDAVPISTIRTNAASGKSISDAILVSGTSVLKGVIQPDTTGAIRIGSITWNATTGALTGGTGIALTQWGIIGAAAGVATFSIEAATGAAVFKGNITGASGTFSGDLNIGGRATFTGGYDAGFGVTAVSIIPSSNATTGLEVRKGAGSTGTSVIFTNNAALTGTLLCIQYGAAYCATFSGGSGVFMDALTATTGTFSGATTLTGLVTLTAGITGNVLMATANSNLSVGNATLTGSSNICIKEGAAGASTANQIQVYADETGDATTSLGMVTEQAVVAGTGAFSGINQIKITWNAVEYWLPLQVV